VPILNRYGGGFLGGGSTAVDSAVSEEMLHAFAMEVKARVDDGEARASAILTRNRAHLQAMADRLQNEETLEGSALEQFLNPVVNTAFGN